MSLSRVIQLSLGGSFGVPCGAASCAASRKRRVKARHGCSYAEEGGVASGASADTTGAAPADGGAAATSAAAAAADDEDKLAEEEQTEFTKVKKAVRTTGGGATGTVRNLRIREDTAKYLLNLDPKSAHYDPKSRSMRADPNPDKAASEKTFAGDNALRESGEYEVWRQVTEHTVLEAEKGGAGHLQAAPTQAVLAHEAFKRKKAALAAASAAAVAARYGNAAAAKPDADLLLPASEAYVEYDRTCAALPLFARERSICCISVVLACSLQVARPDRGRVAGCLRCVTGVAYEPQACACRGKVVRGQEHVATSRYDEDVFPQNHTSVWGSFWENGRWGYACCKALTKNSMCLGTKAQEVRAANAEVMAANAERAAAERAAAAAARPAGGAAAHLPRDSAAIWGTEGGDDASLDEDKVQAALIKLRETEGRAPEDADTDGGRDVQVAQYNGLGADGTAVTPEEMAAYRRFRARAADPMEAMGKGGGGAGGYEMV